MADEIRQSIRLTRHVTAIVRGRATEMWPELDGNINGLVNKIITDWNVQRDDSGGSRREQIKALDARLTIVEQKLEALTNDPTDYTDHA